MTPREGVTLEPALAQVLAQHLHHPTVGSQVVVGVEHLADEASVGLLEDCLETVAGGLVG